MTHPTDEELDALVEMLQQRNKSKHGYSGHPLYNRDGLQAADAITTLRAQLAEARAERDYDRRQSEHKSAVIDKLNSMLARSQESLAEAIAEAHACGAEREAWKDRAERAEAERDAAHAAQAAQIIMLQKRGARLGEAATVFRSPSGHIGTLVRQAKATVDFIDRIIAQPHDRTALDRMLRAERDKVLRDVLGLRRYDQWYDERAECVTMDNVPDGDWISADAILAMVKQEGGE